jgi:hypothetical protein
MRSHPIPGQSGAWQPLPFLDVQFADMIHRWKVEDPAPRPQQALPSSTIHTIATTYGNSLSLKR